MDEISVIGRNTMGRTLVRMDPGENVVDVARAESSDEMKRKMIPSKRSLLSTHGFSRMTEEKYLKPEKRWKLLEHTADIRLEVYGATLEDLFINAALGFSNIILPEAELTPQTELEIKVEADSAEELLVKLAP